MILRRAGELVRKALQNYGLDLVRFRSLNTIFSRHGVNVVFDVGANCGQYGASLRAQGYWGKIVSFEPQAQPFATLSRAAARDGNWTAIHAGLGAEVGQKEINIYSQSVLSSMLALDPKKYNFGTEKLGTETIEIRTFDTVCSEHTTADDGIFLKVDTQGFEKPVLQGAEQSLARLLGIQIEMSLTPLYDGQPPLEEMVALLRSKGFVLWQIQRGLYNRQTGQELETDGVFLRADRTKM